MPYIGAYWGNRPQTLDECASSLIVFLTNLKKYNEELFGNWFEQGMSKKAALSKPVEIDREVLSKLISKKKKGFEYPDTNYRLSLWNGAKSDDFGIVLRISLGGGDTRFCLNSCLLEFGENDVYNSLFSNILSLGELKKVINKIWAPDNVKINE
ncbi:MAG: Imm52 family immunity protein [Janthinobacterium lividum]